MDISSAPSYLPSPSPELFLFLRAYIEKVLCSFIFAGTFRNYQKLLLKFLLKLLLKAIFQPTFICSDSTAETPEQCVKSVQS